MRRKSNTISVAPVVPASRVLKDLPPGGIDGIAAFSAPGVAVGAGSMRSAHDLLVRFLEEFARQDEGHFGCSRVDLAGLDCGALAAVDEVTGEGEVSIRISGPAETRIQETAFAGVWRVRRYGRDARLAEDFLEGGPIPEVVASAAQQDARLHFGFARTRDGAPNAAALIDDIQARMKKYRAGAAAHVVNLSLLDLSPADHDFLETALGIGPVAIHARAFGNCRIASTCARHVWRVQYFNSMQAVSLNTIEVVDVPEAALAGPEDIADSRESLAELIEWLAEPRVA